MEQGARGVVFPFPLSESIAQMAVFLTRIAEKCFDLSADDRHGFIKKGITYGNLEPHTPTAY